MHIKDGKITERLLAKAFLKQARASPAPKSGKLSILAVLAVKNRSKGGHEL
jgi:hypothetical protein